MCDTYETCVFWRDFFKFMVWLLRKWAVIGVIQKIVVKQQVALLVKLGFDLGCPPSQDASDHQDDITFLVGDPYKPSFATVTGREDNPRFDPIICGVLYLNEFLVNL